MNSKHGRDKRTAPKGASHLAQNQEEQDRRGSVEEDVGQMMSARMQSVQLAVELVRKPGQWMPVGRMELRECPNDAFKRQTPGDNRIIIDILVVVEIDEIVMQCLPETGKGAHRQRKAQHRHEPARGPIGWRLAVWQWKAFFGRAHGSQLDPLLNAHRCESREKKEAEFIQFRLSLNLKLVNPSPD